MKIAHIIYTPFTDVGCFNPDNKWLIERIRIFKNFTKKSLLRQESNFDLYYTHWLSFRKGDEDNNLIANFATDLSITPLFSGLLYYDDRFVESSEKNRRIADRLECIKEFENNYSDVDWIYFTRLDSDDMFHKDAFAEIMKQEPKEKTAFIFQKGYIVNEKTSEMAEWNPETCPPFYTICFPKDVFFNPQKHLEYMKGWKSHEDTVKIFNPVYMSDRKYCVLVHGKNTTTTWNHRFRGKAVDNNLLNNFI
jgi:hypothetical protein